MGLAGLIEPTLTKQVTSTPTTTNTSINENPTASRSTSTPTATRESSTPTSTRTTTMIPSIETLMSLNARCRSGPGIVYNIIEYIPINEFHQRYGATFLFCHLQFRVSYIVLHHLRALEHRVPYPVHRYSHLKNRFQSGGPVRLTVNWKT